MRTLIHLCRKDFASAKHTICGAWMVFLGFALVPAFVTDGAEHGRLFHLGAELVPWFQVIFLTLMILRVDPFTGSNSFIGTRPVSKSTMWFSKMVSIFVFVMVPCLFAQFIGVLLLGVKPGPSDWAIWWVGGVLGFGVPVTIAWIVGTTTRSAILSTGFTMALILGICLLFISLGNDMDEFRSLAEAEHLKASRSLVACLQILIAGPLLAGCWIVWRRVWWSIATCIGTAAVITIVSTRWNFNFVERLVKADLNETPTLEGLRITTRGRPLVTDSRQDGTRKTTVSLEASVDGVPNAWTAHPAGIKAIARFRDGGMIHGVCLNQATHGTSILSKLPSLGIGIDEGVSGAEPCQTKWFETESWRLADYPDRNCTITGESWVEFYQPCVLAVLSAESGAVAVQGCIRCEVENVRIGSDVISMDLTLTHLNLSSRGEPTNFRQGIALLLINQNTRQRTDIRMGGAMESRTMRTRLSPDFRIQPSRLEGEGVDPRAFLKDAKLYLIGARYGGTARVRFELPEIRLGRKP